MEARRRISAPRVEDEASRAFICQLFEGEGKFNYARIFLGSNPYAASLRVVMDAFSAADFDLVCFISGLYGVNSPNTLTAAESHRLKRIGALFGLDYWLHQSPILSNLTGLHGNASAQGVEHAAWAGLLSHIRGDNLPFPYVIDNRRMSSRNTVEFLLSTGFPGPPNMVHHLDLLINGVATLSDYEINVLIATRNSRFHGVDNPWLTDTWGPNARSAAFSVRVMLGDHMAAPVADIVLGYMHECMLSTEDRLRQISPGAIATFYRLLATPAVEAQYFSDAQRALSDGSSMASRTNLDVQQDLSQLLPAVDNILFPFFSANAMATVLLGKSLAMAPAVIRELLSYYVDVEQKYSLVVAGMLNQTTTMAGQPMAVDHGTLVHAVDNGHVIYDQLMRTSGVSLPSELPTPIAPISMQGFEWIYSQTSLFNLRGHQLHGVINPITLLLQAFFMRDQLDDNISVVIDYNLNFLKFIFDVAAQRSRLGHYMRCALAHSGILIQEIESAFLGVEAMMLHVLMTSMAELTWGDGATAMFDAHVRAADGWDLLQRVFLQGAFNPLQPPPVHLTPVGSSLPVPVEANLRFLLMNERVHFPRIAPNMVYDISDEVASQPGLTLASIIHKAVMLALDGRNGDRSLFYFAYAHPRLLMPTAPDNVVRALQRGAADLLALECSNGAVPITAGVVYIPDDLPELIPLRRPRAPVPLRHPAPLTYLPIAQVDNTTV